MRIVIDASAVVDGLLGLSGAWRSEHELYAPGIIDYEVHSALRRLVAGGATPAHEARESLDLFRVVDIDRHPAHRLLARMWELRHDVTSYDASYVALAEALGLPLLTLDRRLARAASRYCDVIGV